MIDDTTFVVVVTRLEDGLSGIQTESEDGLMKQGLHHRRAIFRDAKRDCWTGGCAMIIFNMSVIVSHSRLTER
jgi:hypothetical protein